MEIPKLISWGMLQVDSNIEALHNVPGSSIPENEKVRTSCNS